MMGKITIRILELHLTNLLYLDYLFIISLYFIEIKTKVKYK